MADERERAQIDPILAELGAAAWPPEWRAEGRTADYLYRPGAVLTATGDAARVQAALVEALRRRDGNTEVNIRRPDEASGVVLVEFIVPDGDDDRRRRFAVPEILEDLDAALGPAVARPDHVLYVCGHPCPAGEPIDTASDAAPTASFAAKACPGTHGGDGRGVSVAIVDTGLDADSVAAHPWLDGVDGEPDTGVAGGVIAKYGGHGTFSAGCLRTVAAKCTVYVTEALPRGIAAQYESRVAAAVERVLDRGTPDVLLVCFASRTHGDYGLASFDDLYRRRLRELTHTAVLAPAGNDGWSTPMFPAAYKWVTAVGALDVDCADRADYSNYGWWVDVWAPGTHLVNAFVTGDYTCDEDPNVGQVRSFKGMACWSGTSFATPLVAGMVAERAQADGITAAAALRKLLVKACWPDGSPVGPRLIPG